MPTKNSENPDIRAFRKLNRACQSLERDLKRAIVELNADLLNKLKSGKAAFMKDFRLTATICLYLDENHPDWVAGDTSQVGSITFSANLFPPYNEGAWCNLADGNDWNPNKKCKWYRFRSEKHCFTISSLIEGFKQSELDLLEHVSDVVADLEVSYHHSVILRGQPHKSEKLDWSPIPVMKVLTGK